MLIVGDLTMFVASFFIAQVLRHQTYPSGDVTVRHVKLFAITYLMWILVNYINGLYDLRFRSNKIAFDRRIFSTALMSLVVGVVFFYIIPSRGITPKTILLFNVVIGYALLYAWRIGAERLLGISKLQTNVVFVGYSEDVSELVTLIEGDMSKGYRVCALVDPEKKLPPHEKVGMQTDIYHAIKTLRPIISNKRVDMVVIAGHLHGDEETMRELYELLFWPVQLIHLPAFYERLTGRIPPSTFSESWFLDHLRHADSPVYERWKSLMDYAAALILGVILLLLLPFVALAIKLTSRGPLFYSQKRVGKGGETFMLYKFRSMYALTQDGSAEIGGYEFTRKDDERITPVGNFLRKMRIDELPQVLNLLRRDITLIGPRPERPDLVNELTEEMPYYPLRHVIKPGLSGWAVLHQNYADSKEASLVKLQYDLYYIKNRSFLLDISIILRTFNVVLRLLGQ